MYVFVLFEAEQGGLILFVYYDHCFVAFADDFAYGIDFEFLLGEIVIVICHGFLAAS